MGKGQVSEKELSQSIQSLGGLSGFASGASRRDSPFGSDFATKVQPKTEVRLEKEMEVTLDGTVETLPETPSNAEAAEKPKVSGPHITPQRKSRAAKPIVHPQSEKSEQEKDQNDPGFRFEGVTVKMTSAMRDDLNFLATKLQRRRTTKEERITANTVVRVAIQFLLDELKLNESDSVNNEEELLTLARRKLLRK